MNCLGSTASNEWKFPEITNVIKYENESLRHWHLVLLALLPTYDIVMCRWLCCVVHNSINPLLCHSCPDTACYLHGEEWGEDHDRGQSNLHLLEEREDVCKEGDDWTQLRVNLGNASYANQLLLRHSSLSSHKFKSRPSMYQCTSCEVCTAVSALPFMILFRSFRKVIKLFFECICIFANDPFNVALD